MSSTDPKDQENLMTIAREVAKATVDEMGVRLDERDKKLRESIVEDVRKELKSYFGDQSASDHLIEHNRIAKFLTWVDGLGKNFWSSLISNVIRSAVTGAIAVLVYSKWKG
jgi:ribosomal protein S13